MRQSKASGSRGFYSTYRWRKDAAAYLIANPWCACGCGRPSAFVDHIEPIKDPRDLSDSMIWSRRNWQALADYCHRLKSRIEQGERGDKPKVRVRRKGCYLDGTPKDNHYWDNWKS